jgi:integrase
MCPLGFAMGLSDSVYMSREGSVKKDASGKWKVVLDVTPPGATKRKQVLRRGFATKSAALDALDDLKGKLRSGSYVVPTKQTFGEYLDEWLKTITPTVRPATLFSYKRNLELHVKPRIGGVLLQALDPGVLNVLFAELLADGNQARDGGLSPRTVRYIATIIHRALKDAVKWRRLERNPADAADPPKASASKRASMETWSAEQLRDYLQRTQAANDRYHAFWVLLATTGMRRGEALGLRWSDLDLTTGVASIVQTVIVVDHHVQLGSPKTAQGIRTVDLDTGTMTALKAHRKRQAEERLLVGDGWHDHGLVFCKVDGEPLHPERVSRELLRRIERWKLAPLTLHGLRHTWATLALKAGVHPKVVQERLGHATIGITLGTYSHVTAGMQREAAETVAGLLL